MSRYLIFRNVSTASLSGIEVARFPSHKKASMRNTEYYVKGRDGALHVDEGYANFDIQAVLFLNDASAANRQVVNAWADGTGKLISSDDPTLAYEASVKKEVEWKRTKGNSGYFDTAKITFSCQPGMVEAVESVIEITSSQSILNPGSMEAFPLIKVEGSGDVTFSIAGYEISIADMTAGTPVWIDCANGYVYTEDGPTTMTGEIPVLPLGSSNVVLDENITKLTVTPHWRWI